MLVQYVLFFFYLFLLHMFIRVMGGTRLAPTSSKIKAAQPCVNMFLSRNMHSDGIILVLISTLQQSPCSMHTSSSTANYWIWIRLTLNFRKKPLEIFPESTITNRTKTIFFIKIFYFYYGSHEISNIIYKCFFHAIVG